MMTWQDILNDLTLALPIVLLCATALVILVVDWFLRPERSYHAGILALIGLLAATYYLTHLLLMPYLAPGSLPMFQPPITVFGERLILDSLTLFFMFFFVVAALATVVVSLRTKALQGKRVGEYYSLLLIATAAMAVVIAARDFLLLYVAIETVSLSCYVLVGYHRRERLTTEASLKYILYGGVASGVMLFGISYIYGLSGTTVIPNLYEIETVVVSPGVVGGGVVRASVGGQVAAFCLGLILLLAGLGFKMALVPFHSWCPDVYEGAPTPITAYLSVASKGAGFAAVIRILYPVFSATELGREIPAIMEAANPWLIFWVLSVVTMTLGNLVAIWQTNVKRLLAYSSIAHAGYMAMAFTLLDGAAFEALLIYILVYLVMNLGAFFTVLFIENATGRCDLPVYAGLVRRAPLLVAVLTIFLLSLLGIPPTIGFMAKFKMFGALIKAGTAAAVWLAVIGIANSVVSAYYYLKVVKAMVFDQGEDESPIRVAAMDSAVVVVFAAAVFVIFILWTPVENLVASIPLDVGTF